MTVPSDYPNMTACLEANRVDPTQCPAGTEVIVYKIEGDRTIILGRGPLGNCDGIIIVLDRRPDEYDTIGGLPILHKKDAPDPDEPPQPKLELAGLRVASGQAYQEWLQRVERRRRLLS